MVSRPLLRSTNKLPHFRENIDQKNVTGRGALREPDAKKKSHPFGWRLFLCCQNIIDQQINRAYGSTPAAGPPPCPCAFSFGCAKSCDALHRGRLSTAKCLRSNHEFAAGPIFPKEMPSIWMAFLFGAGYGSRTRLLGLGSRCTTDVRILRCMDPAWSSWIS